MEPLWKLRLERNWLWEETRARARRREACCVVGLGTLRRCASRSWGPVLQSRSPGVEGRLVRAWVSVGGLLTSWLHRVVSDGMSVMPDVKACELQRLML